MAISPAGVAAAAVMVLVLAGFGSSAWAQNQEQDQSQPTTRVLVDDKLKTASLTVSACADGSPGGDCVSQELICDRTGVLKLYLGEDRQPEGQLARIAGTIIGSPYPGPKAKIELGSAQDMPPLPILGVQAVGDDLSGRWDFQLLLGEGERLVEALSKADTPGFLIDVTGLRLEFAPGQNDVPKLVEFGERCTGFAKPELATVASKSEPAAAPKPTPRPKASAPKDAGGTSAVAAVRGFYEALGRGDGGRAARFIIPQKRNKGPFSAAAMSRFYGGLSEPLRLLWVEPADEGEYLAAYRFRNQGDRCEGRALVRTVPSGQGYLIRSIRALNGC